jgi:hypothetical protein
MKRNRRILVRNDIKEINGLFLECDQIITSFKKKDDFGLDLD